MGLLSAVWFFVGYPSQDPRSIIDISEMSEESIEQKATDQFEMLGFDAANFSAQVRFESNIQLLDSLQQKMGRDQMVAEFQDKEFPNFFPFKWEVLFIPRTEKNVDPNPGNAVGAGRHGVDPSNLSIRLNQDGELLEVVGGEQITTTPVVNRSAIASTFGNQSESAASALATFSDTTLSKLLIIDLQRQWKTFELSDDKQLDQLQSTLEQREPFRLSSQDVFNMASYYLQDTGWSLNELAQDSVYMGRTGGESAVTAKFHSTDPSLDQDLSLIVKMSTLGGLMNIRADYNPEGSTTNGGADIWGLLESAIIALFVIGVIVLFFFRSRVRAIDTQPALVVSILAGLSVSMMAGLYMFHNNLNNGEGWSQNLELLIGTGLSGAGTSLAIFVMFAVADSVTRQYWPEKLKIYDYVRQGMVFNKPVGYMLVRSVTLAFVLAGIWTLLLWTMPQLYFEFEETIFLSQQAAWPPLFVTFSNGIYSLLLVLGTFMIVGSQALSKTSNKAIAAALMIIACGIFVPFAGYFGPALYEFIGGIVMGAALVLIYMQWDFLTLLFSHFLFLGLMTTTTGWIIPGSLDTYLFILIVIMLAILFAGGLFAIGRGKEEKLLSRYVPQYVEELAQEERIKQELQIAREVQQSFLPVQTPEFADLDLAAMCKPAYETGGDYYDFVQLDDHRVAVMIGDVSGKGIQAAFYMTFVKGVIHTLCRETDSPAEVLKKTNRLFCDNAPRGTFISLVYGIVDLKKRTFHFARAGHNPILRITSDNGKVQKMQPSGIGIGLAKGERFEDHIEEVEVTLAENDLLVLYTDGIVEALNERETFYGEQRLNNLLKRSKRKSSKDILETLSQDVKSFVGKAKQHDDMTMLVMKLAKH